MPPSFCQKHLYMHTCTRLVWIQICAHRTVEWSWALGTDGWKALSIYGAFCGEYNPGTSAVLGIPAEPMNEPAAL